MAISQLEVYSGKQADYSEKGLGYGWCDHCVLTFTINITVVFDNYFTAYNLLEDLLEDRVYGCCTAQKERCRFPQLKLKNKK